MAYRAGVFFFLFFFGCQTASIASDDRTNPESSAVVGGEYRQRYPLKNATQKLIDNKGNGYEDLYGTRNVRAVLNGVYYRGGANNAYHRSNKRANMNPLPNDGLANLCEQGFSTAIYLYSENYSSTPKATDCRKNNREINRLEYQQHTSLSSDPAALHRILNLIHDHIMNPEKGPIYAHCWNGWHASGYAAATALRQFCGFSAEDAVRYWNVNTDGNSSGSNYDRIRERIRQFSPLPGLNIPENVKKVICPNPQNLEF